SAEKLASLRFGCWPIVSIGPPLGVLVQPGPKIPSLGDYILSVHGRPTLPKRQGHATRETCSASASPALARVAEPLCRPPEKLPVTQRFYEWAAQGSNLRPAD